MSDQLVLAAPLWAGDEQVDSTAGETEAQGSVEVSGASVTVSDDLFETGSADGDQQMAAGAGLVTTTSFGASNGGGLDTPVFAANDDFGDDETTEDIMLPEDLIEGEINSAGDEDWFLVTLKSNFIYVLDLRGSATGNGTLADPLILFGDQQGDIVDQDADSGSGANAELRFTVDDAGDYFAIAAAQDGTSTGTYEFILVEVDDFAADFATDGQLSDGDSVNGEINVAGDQDGFAIDVIAGVTYEVTVTGDSLANPLLTIFDSEGGTVASDDDSGPGSDPFLSFTATSTGTVLAMVSDSGDSQTGTYSISLEQLNRDPETQNETFFTVFNTQLEDSIFGLAEDPDGDNLTFSLFSDGSNGSASIQGDGTFTYDPDPGFTGNDSFVYRVSDGNGGTATGTVTVTVTDGSNAPPVVSNGDFTANEDELFSGTLAGLATDADGDNLTFALVGEPENGVANVNADGTFTYLGGLDYEGPDDFRFSVTDGTFTITRTADITVQGVFDLPTARDDTFSTDEDVNLSGDVTTNDNLGDSGDPTFIVLTSGVTRGRLVLQQDGTFDYTVDEDFNGTQSFSYRLSDGVNTDTATVTITVNSINDRPGAGNAALETAEDTQLNFDLADSGTAFDVDEGESLDFEVEVDASDGTLVLNLDGSFTYTPDANFTGTDSFTYKVTDPGGLTDTAVVTITVTPVNDAPVAQDDSFTAISNVDIDEDVSTNDSDVDGDDLTFSLVTGPVLGDLTFNADGTFSYTPEDGFEGSETFVYRVSDSALTDTATVTLLFTGVNDPPTANDDTYTTGEDTPLVDDVTDNDTDPDLTALDVTLISDVSNGTLQLNVDGTFTYTPGAQYVGPDSFSYRVSDGEFTDTATVSITVTLIDDTPIANADSATVDEDSSVAGNVLTNDTDEEGDDLTASLGAQASNGTASVAANGAFTYTPDADFNGTDSFTYRVTDGNSTATGTVTVTINPVNDAPQAVADSFTGDEDEELTGSVASNDVNVDADQLTYTVIANTTRGALSLNADGSFTYTPVANQSGTDSFTYRVSDGSLTDTATASITIDPVNDAPDATDDTGSGAEDNPITGNVLGNDSDIENDPLTASLLGQASTGTAVVSSNGDYTYTPDDDFNGTDSFTYRVSDGDRVSTGTVRVTVTPVNDAPVAVNDTLSASEDETLVGSVADNDIEVDGDELIYTLVSDVSDGALILGLDGSVSYIGRDNFSGQDSFVYRVSDGQFTDTATATINIAAVNDAPDAVADTASGDEDTQITGNVLGNDSDIEGDDLTASLVEGAANGEVAVSANGDFTYTPDDDFNGTDSFIYRVSDGNDTATATVTVTVNPVNDAPTAGNDSFSVDEETELSATVAGNDEDIDQDNLTFTLVSGVSSGVLNLNSDGSFTYTGNGGFRGNDSFVYRVSDGSETDTATATIAVQNVNDRPTAVNDTASGNQDSPINGNVVDNDSDQDGDDLTATLVEDVENGSVVLNTDGSFTYTPDQGFVGQDSFTYRISDGDLTDTATVSLTVLAVNQAPNARRDEFEGTEDQTVSGNVAGNDTDPEDDNLTFSLQTGPESGSVEISANGDFVYTPDANFNGTDEFRYRVSDGDLTDTARVVITLSAVNDAPVAVTDTRAGEEDTPITGNVLDNDSDADGDSLTVTLIGDAVNGSVNLGSNGDFTYTPDADFSGSDSFTYRVSDGSLTDTATVNLIIGPVDDGPVAVPDSFEGDEDSSITGSVADNDFDGDGDALSFAQVSGPDNGALSFNADGSFTYTPDDDFSGSDSFTYRVTAGEATDTATVTLTVTEVNDAPIANDDTRTGVEDTDLIANVINNDEDVEGDELTASLATGPSNGTVIVNESGRIRYTPDANFSGTDSFTYRVTDGQDTDIGTVFITITEVPDAPVAEDDSFAGDEDQALTGDVSDNDSDGDGDALTFTLVEGPQTGTLGFNADGSFSFAPVAEFSGTESFTYRVSDGDLTDTATARLEIAEVNDAPVANPDSRSSLAGQEITGSLLDNDTDIEGDDLTASLQSGASNGEVTVNPDGTFSYTPDNGFSGTDSFVYAVSDGDLTDTATVTIFVAPQTSGPVANPDSFESDEDTQLTGSVALNDFDGDGDALGFSLRLGVANGELIFNGDGSFVYTPEENDTGDVTFFYTLIAGGETATSTATITLRPVNDAPVAQDDAGAGEVGQLISGNLLENDSDIDGDDLSTSLATAASDGNVVVTAGGVFRYTPDDGFTGEDSFTYRLSDGSLTDTATVTVLVVSEGSPPVARDDAFSVVEDGSLSGTVGGNDADPAGQGLSFQLQDGADNGTVSVNTDGSFTYTPDANFSGTDSFVYAISNADGSDTATVTITVDPVADAPVAVADLFSGDEDAQITGSVLANDSDVDGDALTVSLLDAPEEGELTLNADGSFTYTPDAQFAGQDSFTYRLSDGGLTDTALVTLTINPVNDAPIARDDVAVTLEDNDATGTVATNDTDEEGDALSFSLLDGPSNGDAVINQDGSFSYTPDENYNGTDSLTYQVSDGNSTDTGTLEISIISVNDEPLALDDTGQGDEDSQVTGNVLTNDRDIDGDDLVSTLLTGPRNGSVQLAQDGSYTYTPVADFFGTDSFTYRLFDGTDTDTATVTITVNGVNDAPVARADARTLLEDTTLNSRVDLNDNDPDGDSLTYTLVAQDAGGSLSFDSDGSFSFTPDADSSGQFSFTYRVSDGQETDTATVSLTILAVNDAPVAMDDSGFNAPTGQPLRGDVSGNDTDAEGDDLVFSLVEGPGQGALQLLPDGSFTYTAGADATGTDSFTYRVSDGEATDTATVSLSIVDGNARPLGVDDSFTGDEGGTITGNVLANDTDADGDALTATLVSDVSDGTLVLNADGSFTYTPAGDFAGADSFTYRVSDGVLTDTATVSLTVTNQNDAPVANDDTFIGQTNLAISGSVTGNDRDADGDQLTVSLVSDVSSGTLVLNADGTFTYTPATSFEGTETFTYRLSDGVLTDTATVTLTTAAANLAPTAATDTVTLDEDTTASFDVTANDSDPEGGDLTVTLVAGPGNGSLVLQGDGAALYTPDADYSGTDSFTYRISDGQQTDTATVSITVTPVEDAPIAVDDTVSTDEDNPVSGNVLGNDSDGDDDSLTVSVEDDPLGGSLTLAPDGNFTYTPFAHFNGTDSFTYTLSDGALTARGRVVVTVNAVDDAPIASNDRRQGPEGEVLTGNVLLNDADIDGDALSVALVADVANGSLTLNPDGDYSYTPDDGFAGTDSFTYRLTAGGQTDTATVTLTITPEQQPPEAEDDSFTLSEDSQVSGSVAQNDSDPDGDSLLFQLVSGPSDGVVGLALDGSFTYSGNADFAGTDSFVYRASDGNGGTDTATVTLTVTGVNDAPVASNDQFAGAEDTPLNGNVLTNDRDVDGDQLTVILDSGPANGELVLNADGTFTYTGDTNFNGTDSFSYTVSDGQQSDGGQVFISLAPVNDRPTGQQQGFEVDPNVTSAGQLLADDVDGDQLTFLLETDAENGTVTVAADGQFTYTPQRDFSGEDSFRYAVTDGALTQVVTVLLDVAEVEDDQPADDVGDTPGTASELVIDVVTEGRIGHRGDVDVYSIEISEGGTYVIQALGLSSGNGSLPDPFLRLIGQDGSTIVDQNDNAGEGADAELSIVRFDFSATQSGTFFVEVSESSGQELGDYRVVVKGSDFVGTDGGDEFTAGEADDVLVGGRGRDFLDGRGGFDEILGGRGGDTLLGGDGDDVIRGENGNDRIEGGTGNDDIDGGRGDDTIFGDDDEDIVRGNAGDDFVAGGSQDDALNGGGGDDQLRGDRGDDILEGAKGDDQLDGARGDDQLIGGKGRDILTGGEGADIFRYNAISHSGKLQDERDRILDFNQSEGDKIDLSGIEGSENFVLVDGPSGQADEMWQTGNRFKLDTSGNGVANLQIEFEDLNATLTIDDFIL